MHRSLTGYPALHERAHATLESVGLADRAGVTVRQLSHGEQRQLEIGLALAGSPRLLLLDEPTAGLSPAESQSMAQLLMKLDPAMTVLIIEHDMDIALEIARHVTVLHYGRVIADGTREEIRAHPLVREIYLGA
jgi:ABC-type branched-subunit amino acid transport system ATPase component